MARRTPPRKVTYFEPVARPAWRATPSSSRRSRSAAASAARCASIAASSTLARAGCNAVYKLAALTIGARLLKPRLRRGV